MTLQIRPIRPQDYWPVISVIDDWWNSRHMADKLPRLFFEHFTDTSFAAERHGEREAGRSFARKTTPPMKGDGLAPATRVDGALVAGIVGPSVHGVP